jgi:hypothetical protein
MKAPRLIVLVLVAFGAVWLFRSPRMASTSSANTTSPLSDTATHRAGSSAQVESATPDRPATLSMDSRAVPTDTNSDALPVSDLMEGTDGQLHRADGNPVPRVRRPETPPTWGVNGIQSIESRPIQVPDSVYPRWFPRECIPPYRYWAVHATAEIHYRNGLVVRRGLNRDECVRAAQDSTVEWLEFDPVETQARRFP